MTLKRILDGKINIIKQGKPSNTSTMLSSNNQGFDGNDNNRLTPLRLVLDDGKHLHPHSQQPQTQMSLMKKNQHLRGSKLAYAVFPNLHHFLSQFSI